MGVNVIMRMPGGICYAHGKYLGYMCPNWPKCDTDPKHLEFLEEAGLSNDEINTILGADCYCVCHTPFSSHSYCDHCRGDNEVFRWHQERERLREEVLSQARLFFGSIDRKDTSALLKATGNLLVHEHRLTKTES